MYSITSVNVILIKVGICYMNEKKKNSILGELRKGFKVRAAHYVLFVCLAQWFLSRSDFCPLGFLGSFSNICTHFHHAQEWDVTSTWAEARDTAEHLTLHTTAPQQRMIQPPISVSKMVKPWLNYAQNLSLKGKVLILKPTPRRPMGRRD